MAKTTGAVLPKAGIAFMVFAVAGVACGAVRTNTIVNGASNWNDPNSYADTSFVPAKGDVVIIPDKATVYLSSADTASFNIMSNLSYLCFTHTNSVLEITVPEGGDALFDCKFKGLWEPNNNGQFFSGLVVKKGKGRITAGDGSKYPSGTNIKYYRIPLRIEEGIWRCAQNIPDSSGKEEDYSIVEVAEGATFCLNSGLLGFTTVLRLSGSGTVTTTGGEQREFRILPVPAAKYDSVPCNFSGVFDAGVKYFSNGRVSLTGVNSTMSETPSVFGGYLNYATNSGYTAVMKFGNTGDPSSIGTSGTVDVNVRGGGWGYLGSGETTDKTFRWQPNADGPSLLFDGGANGGLTFSGQWKPRGQGVGCIVLTGSNTVSACNVECPIQYDTDNPNMGFCSPVSVIKTGSGRWRFAHNPSRHLLGVFDIQQGTLQADSLEEAGVQSSLGYATNMFVEGYSNTTGEWPSDKRTKNYAFVLGAEASDSIAGKATEGTLEYTGENSAYCFTRPFVLDGNARFKNSTGKRLWLGKVSSRSMGSKTLTLDGDSSNTNLLADVTDTGAGVVSLAKEGTGTWIVTGTNDIRGDLTVKAGTLILHNINDQPYTWHKWVIRSNWSNVLDPGPNFTKDRRFAIRVEEFGLFDADGKRLNKELVYCSDHCDLEPGQAAYSTALHARYGAVSDSEYLGGWFDGSVGTGKQNYFYLDPNRRTAQALVTDDPSTWRSVTMRLADNTGNVVSSWDYANLFGVSSDEGNQMFGVRSSTLYGSANGANWEILDEADDIPLPIESYGWAFDGRRSSNGHTNCNIIASHVQSVYPFFENMAGVLSVASGATLVCRGAPVVFSRIVLDASGAGTIKNATFAAAGEISVENAGAENEIAFPGLFEGCVDVSNVEKWVVKENGQITARRKVFVRGGTLRFVRRGLCVSVR